MLQIEVPTNIRMPFHVKCIGIATDDADDIKVDDGLWSDNQPAVQFTYITLLVDRDWVDVEGESFTHFTENHLSESVKRPKLIKAQEIYLHNQITA